MNPTLGPEAERLSLTANEALQLAGGAGKMLDQEAAKAASQVLQVVGEARTQGPALG